MYVYFYQYLHILFLFGIIFSVFLTSHKFIFYPFYILFLLLISWKIYGCFLKDYENFIEWKYDKNPSLYTEVLKHSSIKLKEPIQKKPIPKPKPEVFFIPSLNNDIIRNRVWWSILYLLLLICMIRYYFKFDLYECQGPLTLTILLFNIYFLFLIIPAFDHYNDTKNIKLFCIFCIYFIIILIGSFFYYKSE